MTTSASGPEHILLGLLREGHGVAAQIIMAQAPLADVRQRLLAELDQAVATPCLLHRIFEAQVRAGPETDQESR